MYPLCMIVGSQWQRDDTVPRRPGQLLARHPVSCIPLSPSHCPLQRQWCQARAHWRMQLRSAVFSDENRFCLGASDGHVLVRRRPGERIQPHYLRLRRTGPTPGVMVWE
ncbi:uncharacterized protein TNCV_3730701 [Trichonephila clavipes]|nr:uncharacterized protein TNCV_3730701 [Trichonephila clavipes]